MLQINGKAFSLPAGGLSLADYLRQEGYQFNLVALEYNGAIIPKTKYETTLLADGDTVEIVNFVGGG
ncbi:MAG: sulfur carrier protein ThiS [Veillonellales bacterium]